MRRSTRFSGRLSTREARTLSSVSHPHICHLYDVGSQSGIDFLVMELLEGETLAARLRKGPVLLGDVFKIAIEITDALAKAHRLGLVHRDLKPANIMLTQNGAKLMDFGLAKSATLDSLAPSTSPLGDTLTSMHSPTTPLTGIGALVGTLPYMSPEQIEGKEADARSDIFSLGAVLYETVTGKRAFEGKSRISVASAILEKEPPAVTTAQPCAPPALCTLISTCLAKDPEERFQSAHDIKLQLRWLAQSGLASPASDGKQSQRLWWRLSVGLAAALVLALVVVMAKLAARPPASDFGTTRFSVVLPPKQELAIALTQSVALSPDGKRLAYVAAESGVSHLYVRRLDQMNSFAIPDSEGAEFPFFSPNGDWIAYYNQGKIKKAPSDGGLPVIVCPIPTFFGGAWTPRDVIVAAVPGTGLATVPASGGTLQKVSINSKDPLYAQGLTWLADGDWIAFTDYFAARRNVLAVNLNSGELKVLFNNGQTPSYSGGHLVYFQGGGLWAVPFDQDKLAIRGNPREIESGISEENYVPQVAISRNGSLAYVPGVAGNFFRNLFLVNRAGHEQKLDVPSQDFVDPAFSPDGKRVAVTTRSVVGPQQLSIVERDRGLVSSFPTTLAYVAPTWALDGRSLFVDALDSSQHRAIYRLPVDGSSLPQLIRDTPHITHITSVAAGYAALMVGDPVTNYDLWLMSLQPPYDMRPFKNTPAVERQGTLSPDGHWIAYTSNESGRSEIYVEPVPGPGGRKQISVEGGEQPRWVRNGREIVYRLGTKMLSVPVQLQPDFRAGKPVELFDRKFDRGGAVDGYDVSPDGQTFVMTRSEHESPTQIRFVLGWPSAKSVPN